MTLRAAIAGTALLPLAAVFYVGDAAAQNQDESFWVRVTHDKTGYPVHSEVDIFEAGDKKHAFETDGCGNLIIRDECELELKLEALPKESNYYRSTRKGCRLRTAHTDKKVKIKVKKLHAGYDQLVQRSILSLVQGEDRRLIWFEYEWDAVAFGRKQGDKCTLEIDIKQRMMDITEDPWERESIRNLSDVFPDKYKPEGERERWPVQLTCRNAKKVEDLIASRYEDFVNAFRQKHRADIKAFSAILGGDQVEQLSCDQFKTVGGNG